VLVLTRREGERIMIGDKIVISVERIGRTKVAIGVSAPRDVPVDRPEVRESVETEGRRREP